MNSPIRILCVFSTLDRGGAESMCMNLYRCIDKTRIQFDFVKHTNSIGAFEQEIASLGGKVYSAPRYSVPSHRKYCKWWNDFLKQHPEYKIIHGHFFSIAAVYFRVAKRYNCVTVSHSHCIEDNTGSFHDRVIHRLKKPYLRAIEKVSDYCFACSKDAGEWLYRKKPFTVLNNAVDAAKFAFDSQIREQMRLSLGLTDDEIMFCVVANIANVKNPIGTIDIFKAIKQTLPAACLVWVGEDRGMLAATQEKVKSEGQTASIRFLGARGDVPDILQAADVFMLCSFNEGLGLAAIEAQAAGLPCLLSNGIPREVAITDLCTFLPYDKPEKWSEVFPGMLAKKRRDTRAEIKAAGYDIHQTAQWLQEFYLKCAEK